MRSEGVQYQPKGSMCAACAKKLDDCSKLNFPLMREHSKTEQAVIVICSEFEKEQKL